MHRIAAGLALVCLLALPVFPQDAASESPESTGQPAAESGAAAGGTDAADADAADAAPAPVRGLEPGTFTVVTINAWSGLTDSGLLARGEIEGDSARQLRMGFLARDIAALEPDIVTVGEANPVYDVADRLSESLGLAAVAHMAEGGVRIGPVGLPVNLRLGDVILSPLAAAPELAGRKTLSGGYVGRTFSFQTGETNQILSAKIRIAGRDVYLFHTRWHESPFATREDMGALVDAYRNGELEADVYLDRMRRTVEGAERRLEEARRTVIAVDEIAGDSPVILTGTLNALPGSPELTVLEKAGFTDAFAVAGRGPDETWDPARNELIAREELGGWGPERSARVDYVLVRGAGIRVEAAEVVLDTPEHELSDHFGVLARITISEGG